MWSCFILLYNKILKKNINLLYIFICKYNTIKKFHNLIVKLQFLHLEVPSFQKKFLLTD